MALLNYTTQIAAEKTVGEIQKMLAKAGAKRCGLEFDGEEVIALSFEIVTAHGPRSFEFPANIDGVLDVLKRQKRAGQLSLPESKIHRAQACRVAWRILKDWLEAQLALIESRQATLEQVMFPYLLVEPGTTLFQKYQGQQLELPPAPEK